MKTIERKSTRMTPWTMVACAALMLGASGLAVAQSRFSGIVVFGTSLSDSGNAFALLGDAATPPDFTLNPLLIPSEPYARGGHHFSNGATWVEQFARSLGLADSVRPALATTDPAVTNYAVGAARAYEDGVDFNLGRQVDTFLLRTGGVARPDALYVVEMGANDIRDAFQVYASGGNGGPILQAALTAIGFNVQQLYGAGARQFLVWVSPNVALTPAVRTLGPNAGALATSVTQAFDTGLLQLLAQLSGALPGSSFTPLDADQVVNAIVANPPTFGFTNVTTACLTPNTPPFTCQDASQFLFWDGIHPTKDGHAALAQEAARVLQ
jgi:phospholipase/lecithinase/hemolysin